VEGVETVILGRADLRRVAPYLSDAAIGAGFCAMEGKANPLRATPAIAAAAERAGALIFRDTTVTGIAPEGRLPRRDDAGRDPRGPRRERRRGRGGQDRADGRARPRHRRLPACRSR
jgi:glycine/D-amino acid oxidase-like deaminating enzyme